MSLDSKLKKYILNFIFLVFLFGITFYYLFRNQDFSNVIKYIRNSNHVYICLGMIMVLLFICGESVIIHYIMNSMNHKVSMISCIKYSFIGFFVSSITPGASGGQPAQMYYMSNDGISVSLSSLVLMVVTIAYKAALIVMGLFMFFTETTFIIKYIYDVLWILVIGVVLNIAIIALLFFIIFEQSFAKKVLVVPVIWLGKKHLIRNYEKWTKKILRGVTKYANGASFLKEHKYVIFNVFVLTILQRVCLFLVTYFVYKAFGLSGTSVYQIVTLQTLIALSVDNLPLPGGMGASESIFVIFFKKIFVKGSVELVLPGMVLSRGISFYSIIILGGIVTVITHITRKKGKGNLA